MTNSKRRCIPGTVGELKWYFERRQNAPTSVDAQTKAFLVRATEVFSTPPVHNRLSTLAETW